MRAARLVGLSQDGTSLIVATDDGEEFALPVDERLRAALRGDRPRLGQLEIEMESVLSPRDIQARIRAGASLDEVVRISGMPADRVERFAGPVLLERQHMAGQAMASSVRRRGETSGHRNLRVAVTERLSDRGIDPDTVTWDARRMDDGRWAVTAEYRSGEASRTAEFHFDPRGRYSLAGNDEARWVLGEPGPAKAAPPPRRRPLRAVDDDFVDEAAEPTLDLNDELALVRAVQVDEPDPIDGRVQVDERDRVDEPERDDEPEYDLPERARSRGRDNGRHRPTARTQDERRYQDDRDVRRDPPRRRGLRRVDPDHQPDDLTRQGFGSDESDEAAAGIPDDHRPSAYEEADQDTELQTLYGMLGGEGYAEDSVTIYPGLREEGPVGW
ncbi:MAG TPA: septation protein SepH, partial [Microlunatus sp.]|nr:septation protein SepH [Microlunatus sp.]